MLDNVAVYRRVLLLVVLFAPLGFALGCAVSRGSVRRLAAGFSLYHLLTTAALLALAVPDLSQRGDTLDRTRRADRFEPIAVPGDKSDTPDLDGYETNWTLLELAPPIRDVPPAAVQFYIGLDGFNVWLVGLASVMTLIAVLASWNTPSDRQAGYFAWLFVLQTGLTGAFVAFDIVLFYAFFELTLVPAFFLIGRYGVGGGRREAARTFVVYTLFGSLLTLAGAVGLVVTNPTPLFPQGTVPRALYVIAPTNAGEFLVPRPGPVTFSIPRLMHNVQVWGEAAEFEAYRARMQADAAATAAAVAGAATARTPADAALAVTAVTARATAGQRAADRDAFTAARDRRRAGQVVLFFLLVAGFAVKTPLVPFHSWLPAAYAEAPLGTTLLFSAALAKLGTYGILRVVLPLCPDAAAVYGLPVFGTLGAVGVVYAAFCAYAQRDLKLLAAYSSVSHLGFLVLGLFALNREGLAGAALHMVNHGLTAGGLFAVLAVLYDRYRTLDQHAYGGLAARLPGYTVLTMVLCLAGIGLPGLNGFVSEMLLLASLFDPVNAKLGGFALAAAAAAGLFLSAWYVITMLRRVFFGPVRTPAGDAPVAPLTRVEGCALGVPAVLCLALGLFPQPVLDTMKSDVELLGRHLRAARVRVGQIDRFAAEPAEPPPAARP